jgi:hypothetical protein
MRAVYFAVFNRINREWTIGVEEQRLDNVVHGFTRVDLVSARCQFVG